jgi:hypothetical protein
MQGAVTSEPSDTHSVYRSVWRIVAALLDTVSALWQYCWTQWAHCGSTVGHSERIVAALLDTVSALWQYCWTQWAHCGSTVGHSEHIVAVLLDTVSTLWQYCWTLCLIPKWTWRSCRTLGGSSPVSHPGGPGSNPVHVMWNLWWDVAILWRGLLASPYPTSWSIFICQPGLLQWTHKCVIANVASLTRHV